MSSFVETKKIFPRDDPFPLKFWLKVTYPLLKAARFDTFCLVAPQPPEIEKEVPMSFLGNTKCHLKLCHGLSDIHVICGCCGRQFQRWGQIYAHVNQGGFHRRESSLTGYDGTTASILAHYPAAASRMAPVDIHDRISDLLDTPTLTPPLHEIFLDQPSSPDKTSP